MLLLINISKEKFHFYEFVKPIRDILVKARFHGFIKNYKDLTKKYIEKSSKVIICGTSLRDDEFLENLDKFNWIKNFNKSILGICGGMQIIQLLFNGTLRKQTEIGYYHENFGKEFLSLKGDNEVYHLHNNYVTLTKEFEQFNSGSVPQAIKHKSKEIYGVLFHPEVRNMEMILRFVSL